MSFRPVAGCEWLPLYTQQLRLRNLTRIQGINIDSDGDKDAYIYYTLHETYDSDIMYSSETIPVWRLQQKWDEIEGDDKMRKSNLNCICVKVWAATCASRSSSYATTFRRSIPSEADKGSTKFDKPRPPDRLLFTWGVYFSGLTHLNVSPDVEFRRNTLIFQINGQCFTSVAAFSMQSLRNQASLDYQRLLEMLPNVQPSTDDDELNINSPLVSRSSSPVKSEADNVMQTKLQIRQKQLNFKRSNVRQSYSLNTLRELQKCQRLLLQRERESDEMCNELQRTNIRYITAADLPPEPTTNTATSGHSSSHMQFSTLNELFAEERKENPRTTYRRQQLQIEVETLQCRMRIFQQEKESFQKRIEERRKLLNQRRAHRLQVETDLKERRATFELEKINLNELKLNLDVRTKEKCEIKRDMELRISEMCLQLRGIFNIACHQTDQVYTICGVPFPKSASLRQSSKNATVTSLEINAALGYIAHLVQLLSIIMDRPLRNPIIYVPSNSRVMDVIKDMPYQNREFPLFTKSKFISKTVAYAIYLLNQNIAQICYEVTGSRCDINATIENIIQIFNTLEQPKTNQSAVVTTAQAPLEAVDEVDGCNSAGQSQSQKPIMKSSILLGGDNKMDGNISESHSSVDIAQVPVPQISMTSSQSISPAGSENIFNRNKHSHVDRYHSTGSFAEYELDMQRTRSIERKHSQSESNITFQIED